jgi:hypothetical protein
MIPQGRAHHAVFDALAHRRQAQWIDCLLLAEIHLPIRVAKIEMIEQVDHRRHLDGGG